MANEKLSIKNFAGFKHIEFDFKPINIFIGPQAAGKSIVVKLAYYFKSYLKDMSQGYHYKEYDLEYIKNFKKYFPFDTWINDKFNITYFFTDNIYINIIRQEKQEIKICCSPDLESIKKAILPNYHISEYSENGIYTMKNANGFDKKILDSYYNSKVLNRPQYFIPAGRSFFSSIQVNIFTIVKRNLNIDPFLIDFGSNYEYVKSFKDTFFDKSDNCLERLSENIIHGKYKKENDNDFLIHKDGRKINLYNASSGQQEALPLILMLLSFERLDSHETLYIEEPEAHLYPTAQKQMIELIAHVYNSGDKQLFITTHSPYILAAFNNLLEAGNIIHNKPELEEKVYQIVPKEEVLSINDFVAYSIKDGKKEVLINKETNLVSQNILDDVSTEIAEEFGKLIDLEFSEE